MILLSQETTRAAQRLSSTLERYIQLRKQAVEEILAKKGRDLGIQLFKRFNSKRWAGNKKGEIGLLELRQRAKQGRGIIFPKNTDSPEFQNYLSRVPYLLWRKRGKTAKAMGAMGEYRRKVAAELARRTSGRGALAASFLWYRFRKNQAKGRFVVKNKTGHPLGEMDAMRPDVLYIRGYTEGLGKVDSKYNLVAQAMHAVSSDMQEYISRKEREAAEKAKR